MPARDEASPSTMTVPPWAEAPAHSDALPRTRTVPHIRFSPTDQPTNPSMTTSGPSQSPPMK
jgi:hypothetical protein